MMEHKGCPLPWVSCNDLELVSTQKPDYDHTEIDHGFLFFGHTTQWPFQDPRLEVPTIYKAYFSGLCKGISPQNMALYSTVPPF